MAVDPQRFPSPASLAAGESWAWGELHRLCAPALANYLAAAGVDDVNRGVGEVFVHVARRVGTYTGEPGGLRVLVFTVARRYLREDPSLAQRLADGPSGAAEAGRHQVRSILGELDADQRDVLLLGVAADLDQAEVAAVLDREVAWVEETERRATDALGDVVF